MADPTPAIIVLAAGADSAAAWTATLGQALASRLPVVVVADTAQVPLARRLVDEADVVAHPAEGAGSAIAAGVAARPSAAGWLVLPGHLPRVRPDTLCAVAAALHEHPVTYAQYRGRRGHPVGFAAELYSELVVLGSDDGARRLTARYPSHGVDVDDAGTLADGAEADEAAVLRAVHGGMGAERLERVA